MIGKRGAELSLNVVVVAIIAVLVLVVVAIVFTGGVSNAVENMRRFFNIGTAGQDLEFVRGQCNVACDNAKLMNDPSNSYYCTALFDVKEGNEVSKYSCWSNPRAKSAGVDCAGVSDKCVAR